MNVTPQTSKQYLTVYLPDTRGVTISPFGKGNLKIGLNVFTYSRLPGLPDRVALSMPMQADRQLPSITGTCPGASEECLAICYAARPVAESGPVMEMWSRNSATEDPPSELPPGATHVRLHISGDFTSERYIRGWIETFRKYPEVKVWAYTKSWRVSALLPALEELRALPNVQLFASMDASVPELPPAGWRRAWIDGDPRAEGAPMRNVTERDLLWRECADYTPTLICPEETKQRQDCVSCRYCFDGKRFDVTFLRH